MLRPQKQYCQQILGLVQDTRTSDGQTNALRYLAKRLVTDKSPQAVLSTEVPHVMSAPLKMSLLVGCPGS